MTQWLKKFRKWKNGKAPVSKDEVEILLGRVFAERVRLGSGSSHEFVVDVHELKAKDDARFQFGNLTLPVSGGQQVKAFYLRNAYAAAIQLELVKDEDDD